VRWFLACVLAACGGDPRPEPAAAANAPDRVDACVAAVATIADPRDAAVARAACAEQRTHRVPGVAVAIAEHGAIVFRFAHGVRCVDRPGAVAPTTAFRIGSLTKAITAASAYALAERGDLDLDAPLGAPLLRDLGQNGALAQATIRQLLDHRAGLGDVLPDASLRERSSAQQLEALLGPVLAPPGTTWRYANGGYALVGAVLAHTSKLAWPDLVRREVLRPLGMATARATADPQGDVACGHLQEGERWSAFDVREDFDRFAFGVEATAPAGAIVATADDLLRLALALSRTPSERPTWAITMLDAVTTGAAPTGRREGERYAAGVQVVTVGNEIVLRHAGNTGDFAAELVWAPDRGAAAVVLGNSGVPLAATVAAASTRIGIDPRRE
jgi:CubicO group peptidase (beta-lactamase class C family)